MVRTNVMEFHYNYNNNKCKLFDKCYTTSTTHKGTSEDQHINIL